MVFSKNTTPTARTYSQQVVVGMIASAEDLAALLDDELAQSEQLLSHWRRRPKPAAALSPSLIGSPPPPLRVRRPPDVRVRLRPRRRRLPQHARRGGASGDQRGGRLRSDHHPPRTHTDHRIARHAIHTGPSGVCPARRPTSDPSPRAWQGTAPGRFRSPYDVKVAWGRLLVTEARGTGGGDELARTTVASLVDETRA